MTEPAARSTWWKPRSLPSRVQLFRWACWLTAGVLFVVFIRYGLDLKDPGLLWWFAFGAAIGIIKGA